MLFFKVIILFYRQGENNTWFNLMFATPLFGLFLISNNGCFVNRNELYEMKQNNLVSRLLSLTFNVL